AHGSLPGGTLWEIKEEILARDPPSSLDQLVELAIRLDKRFELHCRARAPVPVPRAQSSAVSFPVVASSEPEPIQLGGLHISAAERQRCILESLCMVSSKREGSSVDRGVLASATTLSLSHKTRTSLTALLRCGYATQSCAALIDSGAEGNFMDEDWALDHGIPLLSVLNDPPTTYVLDGHVLSKISRATVPEEPGDLSGVPREYHDLRAVFSRSRSATLSPHRPYNCSIDLIPGSIPPRGKLYSLSVPELEAQRTPSKTRSLISSVLQRTALTQRPFSPMVVWLGQLSGESSS
ncbi:hypothetical protein M9458_054009, partial [Cirrhinus mrigala]